MTTTAELIATLKSIIEWQDCPVTRPEAKSLLIRNAALAAIARHTPMTVTPHLIAELENILANGNSPFAAALALAEADKGIAPTPTHMAQLRGTLPPKPSFPLTARTTFKYVAGWSHLDEWDQIGSYTHESAKPERWDDYGESYSQFMIVRVDAPNEIDGAIREALRDSMSGSRCRHEHDCCGCVSRDVSRVRKLRGGKWAVRLSGSRNI